MPKIKPHVVLTHGAWHLPEHYVGLRSKIEASGFQATCPRLPSCSNERPATVTFQDDVAVARKLLTQLIEDRGLDVLIVAHSYGGKVATEAVTKAMTATTRHTQGLQGGVIFIMYMAAYLPMIGPDAPNIGFPRPDPDPIDFPEDGSSYFHQDPKELFYNDVDADLAQEAESLLVRHSAGALNALVSNAAWEVVPFAYVHTTQDAILLPEWQTSMVESVRDLGVPVDVRVYDCGHSPFLNRQKEMVDLVEEFAAKYST